MSAATIEKQTTHEPDQNRRFSPERERDAQVLYEDALVLLDSARAEGDKPARFVERATSSMPVKEGRPGIGYKGFPGFESAKGFISLERKDTGDIAVRLTAPEGGTFGRPVGVGRDFGAAEDENFERFHSFEIDLTPGEVPTAIHTVPADAESPDELDELYTGNARVPDALLLARVCVDALRAEPVAKTRAVQALGGGVLQHV